MSTTQSEIIASLEARAKALDIPMYVVCQRANVAPTSYYRWRTGSAPNLSTIQKLSDALDVAESSPAKARAA